MSNIFKTNKPVKHVGRTGFDLSSKHAFDMRPAVIRPVVVQHTVPNSSFRISCADLVRTGSLQTAAFLEGKQELDFFFVPYSQLYSLSNDVIFGRGDSHSVYTLGDDDGSFPSYPLACLFYYACLTYAFEFHSKWFTSTDFSEIPFIEFVKACVKRLSGQPVASDLVVRKWCNCLLYSDLPYYGDNPETIVTFTRDKVSFVGGDIFKMLSTLGYGDFLTSFHGHLSSIYESERVPRNSDFASAAVIFETVITSYIISFIHDNIDLDFDVRLSTGEVPILRVYSDRGKKVNLLSIFAYQKVFKDIYRDSIVDDGNYLYTYASSMDYPLYVHANGVLPLVEQQILAHGDDVFPLMTFLRMRCRSYARDLSTCLYSSSQFGNMVNINDAEDALPNPPSDARAGTAYSIRFALAMQKYRETLLRAGNRTKDLLKSEFGVESHYVADNYPRYLGSFDGTLDLNKVSATAESGTYSVGDLAGNVFSSLTGNTIEFTCNDHGVIIGCMSFVPKVLHNAFGLSPFNYKFEQFDFYHEDFENLGLQPVAAEIFDLFRFNNPETTLGFSARYFEYKQNLDQVHDSFTSGAPSVSSNLDGVNSNYVVSKPVLQTISNIRTRNYMLPSVMDSLFVQRDSGLYDGSLFQVILNCSISAVLPMSTLGLPQ